MLRSQELGFLEAQRIMLHRNKDKRRKMKRRGFTISYDNSTKRLKNVPTKACGEYDKRKCTPNS